MSTTPVSIATLENWINVSHTTTRMRQSPSRSTHNDTEREEWILNDEGIYDWQRRSRLSMRAFILLHRAEIDQAIDTVNNGTKQAHFLKYG